MTSPETREVAVVRTVEGSSFVVNGLAGDSDYTFVAVSVNGAGERSTFPSAPVTVRTLPSPELYVAPFGDDAAPLAGTPTDPFASIDAALAAAASIDGLVTIRLAEGSYAEPHQVLESRNVVLDGGYQVSGGSWMKGALTSIVEFAAGSDLPSIQTADFNQMARRSRAGLVLRDSVLSISDVVLRTTTTSVTHCVATVYADASELNLAGTLVDSSGSGSCRIGVESLGAAGAGRLLIRGSVLRGGRTGMPTSASTYAGLATDGLAQATIVDSVVDGLDDDGLGRGITRPSELFGWIDAGSVDLILNRSTVRACSTAAERPYSVDVSRGADLAPSSALFVSNSFLAAPGDADSTTGMRVLARSDANAQLYQNTILVGSRFAPTTRSSAGTSSAVVALEGTLAGMTLVNNLFAFADWGSYLRYGTILDLDGLAGTSVLVGARVEGNVFSYPPADTTTPGLGGGPLIMCRYQGVEFSDTATVESELNESDSYLCRASGAVDASSNRALLENPMASTPLRNAVVLELDGQVDSSSGSTGLLRSNGVALVSPDPVAEVSTDRLGATRSLSNPGVGAFIVP